MTTFDPLYADRLQRGVPLTRYTAARLGGPAARLIVADRDAADLAAIARAAWADDLPVRVLGGGANVLVSDAGWPGLIIINDTRAVRFDGTDVRVESGHGLMALARLCAARGLSGLEWAASVPGTVGGAIVGNAGAHGSDMAANLVSARLIDAERAEPFTLTVADLAYGYRTSALKRRADKRFVILDAVLRLTPGDPAAITARMDEFSAYRRRTQPAGASLGSIFRNPPGDYAGRLIEACGLKGYTVGAAQVSPVHANFFINVGGRATAADYNRLIEHVRAVVRAQTGIDLEPEIERIGEF
ncbi:MAG: UDP-N-acetylmuramate dehydrogenase [Candidatus Flexifilum sp.]|jgi:UDP-N-acetylmuramate dehydrogenase